MTYLFLFPDLIPEKTTLESTMNSEKKMFEIGICTDTLFKYTVPVLMVQKAKDL